METKTLNRYLQNDKEEETGSRQNFMTKLMAEDVGAFLGYVFLFLAIMIVFVLIVNRLKKRYCESCCSRPSASRRGQTPNTEQDSAIAERIQREFDEEEAQQRRMERRKKRKLCYGKALEKYTKILKDEHLYQNNDNIDEEDRMGKVIVKCSVEKHSGPFVINQEAYCSICISHYDVGDKIVWSPSSPCPHIYHLDCILSWISVGKRKCPYCREFFTEKIDIDEIKFQDDDETNSTEHDGDLDLEQHPQELTSTLTTEGVGTSAVAAGMIN